jgi:hypothetical protein
VLFLKLCHLKALIYCFNGERSKEDKGLKSIKVRKKRGERCRCERNYFVWNYIGLFH